MEFLIMRKKLLSVTANVNRCIVASITHTCKLWSFS